MVHFDLMTRLIASIIAPCCLWAASSTKLVRHSDSRRDLSVLLLGTSAGPFVRTDRAQPAALIDAGGRTYLVDCGDGVVQQLSRSGVRLFDLKAIFLTHLHYDHTLGLGSIMAFGWVAGRRDPLPILGPHGAHELVARETSAKAISEDIFRPEIPKRPDLRDLYPASDITADTATEVYRDDAVRVSAVVNTHYSDLPDLHHSYGRDQSLAYRFDTENGSIVFTGDTGPSAAVAALARGCDVLVSEVADVDSVMAAARRMNPEADISDLARHMRDEHMAPGQVGRLAREAGVKRIVLTHIAIGSAADEQKLVDAVKKEFSGEVVLGADLMSIKVAAGV